MTEIISHSCSVLTGFFAGSLLGFYCIYRSWNSERKALDMLKRAEELHDDVIRICRLSPPIDSAARTE
jgi:hypothetical protein